MTNSTELRLAPAIVAINRFIEPHRPWIEEVLECSTSETVTFEVAVPFGQFAADELLKGVVLDRQCLSGADVLRPETARWELPPDVSPRIELIHSREQGLPVTSKRHAWDPHWRETPVALWFKGLRYAVVSVSIPYVSFANGTQGAWKEWLIVNRSEVSAVLHVLGRILAEGPKRVRVVGGKDIPLPMNDSGWDALVLDPQVIKLVKEDYDFFFQREQWFRQLRLPFRRGYLLFGPSGNGKTSVVRAMALHPSVTAFSLDFSNEELHNDALSDLFEAAAHHAPSLVIFEDLDRLYGNQDERENHTRITLLHLLNCLDGIGTKEGIVVVATANHPESLDPCILRRPGRFDRVVPLLAPSAGLRLLYLSNLIGHMLGDDLLAPAVQLSEGFSFAEVREAYIAASQLAYQREDRTITGDDLLRGIRVLRGCASNVSTRFDSRSTGFAPPNKAADD